MPDPRLEGLYGLRPALFGWADLMAAMALGVLAVGLLGAVLMHFRRHRRHKPGHIDLDSLSELQPEARTIDLVRMIRDETDRRAPGPAPWPDRAATVFQLDPETTQRLLDLYKPGPGPDGDRLAHALSDAPR